MPLYIAEVAPAKYRGRMIGLDNMSITGGQLVSYGIGAALASVAHGWRAMVAIGAVPAIVLLVRSLIFTVNRKALCADIVSVTSPILSRVAAATYISRQPGTSRGSNSSYLPERNGTSSLSESGAYITTCPGSQNTPFWKVNYLEA